MVRKLFDAFEFFNELDVLEIRLNTLYDVVDGFIISESIKSHTGNPKPLYFQENRDRFKKFLPKIIHQVIIDTPENYTTLSEKDGKDDLHKIAIRKVMGDNFWNHNELPYSRDAFEKESLIRAMGICSPDDIVMVEDADEIPNPEAIKEIKNNFDPDLIYNLRNKHYWFYLNCLKDNDWIGSTLLTFEKFKTVSVCGLRKYRRGKIIENGGWHFSFLHNNMKAKIENYGEQSINQPQIVNNSQTFINHCIEYGHDFYGRTCKFTIEEINETYPKYLYENQNKFKELIR